MIIVSEAELASVYRVLMDLAEQPVEDDDEHRQSLGHQHVVLCLLERAERELGKPARDSLPGRNYHQALERVREVEEEIRCQ